MVDAIDAVAARSIARCVGTTALRSLSLALLLQLRSLSLAPLLRISADPTSWACGYMTLNLIHTGWIRSGSEVAGNTSGHWARSRSHAFFGACSEVYSEVAGNTSVLPGGSRGEPNFSRCPEVAQKWPVILAYYQGGDGDPNYDRGPNADRGPN